MNNSKPHHKSEPTPEEQWDSAIQQIIIQIASTSTITTIPQSIATLIATGGQYTDIRVHAMFLQRVTQFSRSEVTTYLATQALYPTLLPTYFQLISFSDLTIEQSLRLYFTDFNLTHLTDHTLMNKLLYALADAYIANNAIYRNVSTDNVCEVKDAGTTVDDMNMNDHKHIFKGDDDDCVRIYNACLMLELSLHGREAVGRSRLTEVGFLSIVNDHRCHEIRDFDAWHMRQLYHSISNWSLVEVSSPENHLEFVREATERDLMLTERGNDGGLDEKKQSGRTDVNDTGDAPNTGCACIVL